MSRLEKRLSGLVAQASHDFRLLEPGDHVMVCVSGGKDSLALLYLLRHIQRRAPFPFTLIAVHLDQRQPGYPAGLLEQYFESAGYEYRVVREDTYSIVKDRIPTGKMYCSLCSRLRRGVLYNLAAELGATKVALGHHRDDVIETLLLNAFFAGQLKAMPPRLRSDDGRNVVIRPLVYCAESEIAAFAAEQSFPIVPCGLCGSQPNAQRQQMKRLVAEMTRENPHVVGNLFSAVSNVLPSHLLDKKLWQELSLTEAVETADDGDQLIDPDRLLTTGSDTDGERFSD